MNQDAKKLDDFFSFDKILLDAPCSGSGTLDLNNPKAFKAFSYDLVKNSAHLQYELLKKAIKILKPNSSMVYSTCSILPIENEENTLESEDGEENSLESENEELVDEEINFDELDAELSTWKEPEAEETPRSRRTRDLNTEI